jgi:hypothetical protein
MRGERRALSSDFSAFDISEACGAAFEATIREIYRR